MCHISRRLTLILFSSDLYKHFALFSRGRQQDRWPNHRTVESLRTTTSELSSGNHDDTYATLNYRHTGKCGTLLVSNTMNWSKRNFNFSYLLHSRSIGLFVFQMEQVRHGVRLKNGHELPVSSRSQKQSTENSNELHLNNTMFEQLITKK